MTGFGVAFLTIGFTAGFAATFLTIFLTGVAFLIGVDFLATGIVFLVGLLISILRLGAAFFTTGFLSEGLVMAI